MLLKILIITIIQTLGFHQQNNPKTLYKQQTTNRLTNEQIMIMLIPVAVLIFVTLILFFAPGTESGLVYNGELA